MNTSSSSGLRGSRHSLVNAVNVGTSVRCTGCGHSKPPSEFSNRKIYLLREQIFDHAPRTQKIRCFCCTSRQRKHLKCTICEETKELKYFSGVQRKLAERARCKECVEFQQSFTPGRDECSPSDEEYDDENVEDCDDYPIYASNSNGKSKNGYDLPDPPEDEEFELPGPSQNQQLPSGFQNLTTEAYRRDSSQYAPQGSSSGSGHQTVSKMSAPRDGESNKLNDGWQIVGRRGGRKHR